MIDSDLTSVHRTGHPRGNLQSWLSLIVMLMGVEATPLDAIDRPAMTVGFQHDVIPILTRHGCNAGSCHGAARGQDGFRLSLFGFDPHGDYQRITKRVDLDVPQESLLLLKATGAVPHTGGQRLDVTNPHYRKLLQWLNEGALFDDGTPRVTALHVQPQELQLQENSGIAGVTVTAVYSDGSEQDVTELALFRSDEDAVLTVETDGTLRAGIRGEAFVTARFDVHTAGIPVFVLPETTDYRAPPAATNVIDELVLVKLRKLKLNPASLCSDEVFIRRATVDVIGLLPTEEERMAFLGSDAPDKRESLIDALLERPEFDDLWSAKWAEMLMIREQPGLVSRKQTVLFSEWLHQQFVARRPLHEIAREIITARGTSCDQPATNFYVAQPDRLKVAENVAQLFLGIRLQCAQCHHHPFDRWTMDDYYGFARFYAGIYRKPGEDYRQWSVWSGGAETRHPVTGSVVAARFLGGTEARFEGLDPRPALADWLLSPENPYFAHNLANRVWAHFLGHGLVEPVDDVRISNPPVNTPLYNHLAQRLRVHNFDLRSLAREIMMSQTYQRTMAQPGEVADERNFTHARIRRIPATTLLDCISQVTRSPEKFPGLPLGTRATRTIDHVPNNVFLSTFGRNQRTTPCAGDTRTEPTLSQALHLLNGHTIHDKIKAGGLVRELLATGLTPADVMDRIYVRCLSRYPNDQERVALLQLVGTFANPEEGLREVFWAILNSSEFAFLH